MNDAQIEAQVIEATLETAVSLAVNPGIAPAVNGLSLDLVGIGCKAICQLYNRPGCLCGSGQWTRCHAKELYRDHVIAVLKALKQAGAIPKR